MHVGFLLDVFREHAPAEAILARGEVVTYEGLLRSIEAWNERLASEDVGAGTVASLEADFSANAIGLLLALVDRGAIVVPITPAFEVKKPEFLAVAQVERRITVGSDDAVTLARTGTAANHAHYEALRAAGHPGLVLFTSGSSGSPKAAVHDFAKLLVKFRTRRHRLRSLMFLGFDHIGGVDTLLHSLSNGSTVITTDARSPEHVCALVAKHRIEVLPVAPSFLGMLIASEAYKKHDLSSLKYVTYGAEVMPQSTLSRCAEIFPNVTLLQKYGATEVGTLRSHSKANDSLWVKIGGEGYQTRVVNGILHIKAESSMLGYLNAPSPFSADGWFVTGDAVEVEGDFFRILGRQSDIINVGGEKVYPAEVEEVIQQLDNVTDVAVYGEKHAFMGQIVCARVVLRAPEERAALEARIRKHCRAVLPQYKVPVKFVTTLEAQHTERHKKNRRSGPEGGS